MFSFYRLVEALDEQLDGGGIGIPSSSGVSASGDINPPENPARKKKLLSSPVKPEDKIPEPIEGPK